MRLSKNEIKYLRSFSQKKVRDQEGRFILEGWKPVVEALDAGAEFDLCATVPSSIQTSQQKETMSRIRDAGIRTADLTELELSQVAGTVQAQGIVALVRQRRFSLDQLLAAAPKAIVVCDEVSDPGNLGSIIRTCDWFGVGHLLLSSGCVSMYNEKVVRATTGSIFRTAVVEQSDLATDLRRLRSVGYRIVVTAGDGSAGLDVLSSFPKLALVFGSEAHGVRPEVREAADDVVAIPRYGGAESLNVGVACGIVLSALKGSEGGPAA